MTLCEIVKQAKDGDRFVNDFIKRNGYCGYYYFKDNQIYYHYDGGEKEPQSGDILTTITCGFIIDFYTFLPPEAKFKVGDEVKVIDTNNTHFVITGVELHKNEWSYHNIHSEGIRLDTHRECGLELYTGPKFKVGDRVKSKSSNNILEIKEVTWGNSCWSDRWIYYFTVGTWTEEKGIELAPDICEECGQEVTKDMKFYTAPPIEWDGGDLPKWKAFYLTWKLWDWLAENPLKGKWDWPGWKTERGGRVADTKNSCFACQYGHCIGDDSKHDMSHCIMKDIWPKGCQTEGSPFYAWERDKNTSQSAQTIADFARDKYYEEIRKDKEEGK